jgi:hypothetical protein
MHSPPIADGFVNEQFHNPAPQSQRLPLLQRFSDSLSGILDSFSVIFFCLPFSSLTPVLSSWCSRLLAEE